MGWSTRVEIDQAHDYNAGGIKSEDVSARQRFRPFDPCCETVCSRKLSQHDRGRFIDEAAAGDAENGMFTKPVGRQAFFTENGQIFMGRIFRDAFYSGRGFSIGG